MSQKCKMRINFLSVEWVLYWHIKCNIWNFKNEWKIFDVNTTYSLIFASSISSFKGTWRTIIVQSPNKHKLFQNDYYLKNASCFHLDYTLCKQTTYPELKKLEIHKRFLEFRYKTLGIRILSWRFNVLYSLSTEF